MKPSVLSLLKVSHDGMSFEITKLMLIPVNNLSYLIKLLLLFPACVIYSPFVALSFFCRLIKLLSYYQSLAIVGLWTFFLGIYISLVISQDIPLCETFSRDRASSRNLNVSTDEAFIISSGNLFQYGTTPTLNACWRRRVLHRCWWISKVWPPSPMPVGAVKTVSHGLATRA